jgi:two-component system chemotaxis sensor kinase CheA
MASKPRPARGGRQAGARHDAARIQSTLANNGFELLFEDDGCGLDPDRVRSTAIARGVISAENAARLRDREAIKLIFKSGYTTLATSPSDTTHGSGMSLVRRYVHEAGGKIALASLLGHETRFKVSFPPLPTAPAALDLELA